MKKGYHKTQSGKMAKKGLWYNIHKKRKAKSDKNPKGIAKGCGMVLENRRKKTKYG